MYRVPKLADVSFNVVSMSDANTDDLSGNQSVDHEGNQAANTTAKANNTVTIEKRAEDVRHYLKHTRKLSLEMCQRYGVGVAVQAFPTETGGRWEEHTCITFPWMIPTKKSKPSLNDSVNDTRVDEDKVDVASSSSHVVTKPPVRDQTIVRVKFR